MRTLSLAAAALTALLGSFLTAAQTARADCMASRAFFAPMAGAKLPANPTLYLFMPAYEAPKLRMDRDGARVSFKMDLVSETEDMYAYRIEVRLPTAGHLRVRFEDKGAYAGSTGEARYIIDPAWKRPALKPVAILGAEAERSAWSCSHQDSVNLLLSGHAAVYRLDWATSADDYAAGKVTSLYLPARMEAFFRRDTTGWDPVLELGHVNCFGLTFGDYGGISLEPPIYFTIVAIHPDGSESPRPAKVERLRFGDF